MAAGAPPARSGLVHELKNFVATSAALDNTHIQYDLQNLLALHCAGSSELFRNSLKRVAEGSLKHTHNLHVLCSFGHDKDRIERIKKGIQHGNHGELADFIKQLSFFKARSEESYRDLNAALSDVRLNALKDVRNCKYHEERYKHRKNHTRAVGWTIVAGLLLAAVVGGLVGSLLIPVACTAIAICVGVRIHCSVSHIVKWEKGFGELGQSFCVLYILASRMDVPLGWSKVHLESISTILKYIHETSESHKASLSLTYALDRLYQRFDGYDDQDFSTLQRQLETTFLSLPTHRH